MNLDLAKNRKQVLRSAGKSLNADFVSEFHSSFDAVANKDRMRIENFDRVH